MNTTEHTLLPTFLHTVRLQGLTGGYQYYYRVISNDVISPLYTFWTAFPKNESIRFAVCGDSQGAWDDWQKVREVAVAIERECPQFVLKLGDFVDNGWNRSLWIAYFTSSVYLHNSTLYPVLGNHERQSILYFSYFSLPITEHWYSFENGPVHFIGLSSSNLDQYRITQYLWLRHELQSSDVPFTIVFFHHPLYSSSTHGNSTFLQHLWGPLFTRYHVDLVFSGHDHDYERSIVHNVTYIVTGGGGSPLYDNGHSPWTIYSEKTYHYCLLTANSTTIRFEAKRPDGSVFDSFQLSQ